MTVAARLAWLACAGIALVAAACAPAGDDSDLFPLADGHRWTYQLTTTYADPMVSPERDRLVLSSRGSTTLAALPAWRRSSSSGSDYWVRSDDTGIYRVASKGPMDAQPREDEPPRYVLRKPYAVGTQWSATTTPYVLQRTNESPKELRHLPRYKGLPMNYRIEQVDQQVSTPAGQFSRCLLVRGTAEIRLYVDEAFTWKDVPITTREWYCPGVGLVRVERDEPSPSRFILGGTQVLELLEWR